MHLIRSKYKIDRACGVNLWGRDKSPFNKRQSRPGQHGSRRRKKLSNYALQLIAKQKFRYYYGMKEGQFRRFFKISMNKRGDTGTNLIQMLERRLDTCIYRLKWSATIFGAKQLVNHGHILINGARVDVASYLVSPGDKIELRDKSKNMGVIKHSIELKERDVPAYMDVAQDGLSGSLVKLPDNIEEIKYPAIMDMPMVIEMYSRSM
ncbi:30S ribosomal protein S4 [Candidatus Cytomitobacter primus]|uniref:Small ribosomal subunit protein uS4 n=1 Tax=Candidatus Cytomitobacter primus TaxID=2066024 RepID=A0A5C0UH34_9PROT|nr:30S ribosomal protein S4 [Candidatus Cytomitobacter primus]QEK38612.1 30S ribosomal protein S4 [Candidatus Cytomitobacter primus]